MVCTFRHVFPHKKMGGLLTSAREQKKLEILTLYSKETRECLERQRVIAEEARELLERDNQRQKELNQAILLKYSEETIKELNWLIRKANAAGPVITERKKFFVHDDNSRKRLFKDGTRERELIWFNGDETIEKGTMDLISKIAYPLGLYPLFMAQVIDIDRDWGEYRFYTRPVPGVHCGVYEGGEVVEEEE